VEVIRHDLHFSGRKGNRLVTADLRLFLRFIQFFPVVEHQSLSRAVLDARFQGRLFNFLWFEENFLQKQVFLFFVDRHSFFLLFLSRTLLFAVLLPFSRKNVVFYLERGLGVHGDETVVRADLGQFLLGLFGGCFGFWRKFHLIIVFL
jgi:hypothetical protein